MKFLSKLWRKKPDKTNGTFVLPKDTSVKIYTNTTPTSAVNRLNGGSVIASMGVTSDRPVDDLNGLLEKLDQELSQGQPTFLYSQSSTIKNAVMRDGESRLSTAVIWLLNPFVFPLWNAGPTLLRRLLYQWIKTEESETQTVLYVEEPRSETGRSLIALLGQLGWSTRGPDEDNGFVIEISKKDKPVLTALAGNRYPPTGERAQWLRELWSQRIKAEATGSLDQCVEIDNVVDRHLEAALSVVKPEGVPVPQIAVQLRLQMASLNERGEEAFSELIKCLAEREAGFLLAINPTDGSAYMTQWPDGTSGIEVFPDASAANDALTAHDSDKPVALGAMSVVDVLTWMASENACVGIRTGDPDEITRCVLLRPENIAAVLERC